MREGHEKENMPFSLTSDKLINDLWSKRNRKLTVDIEEDKMFSSLYIPTSDWLTCLSIIN